MRQLNLSLYNTLTRQKEPFRTLEPGKVRMYVCGPTVYDRAHLGNARPYVVIDVLYRLLKQTYEVTYARNITDIDDKIIQASKTQNRPINVITEETTRLFHEDMAALNNLSPTVEPRATEHVAEMISLIQCLIQKGHAYEAQGHVLFDVPSYPSYGRLSRCQQDEILAGARVEVAPYKKNPSDFVLWKPSDETQPGWDSPWGRGRPGWHIECSAMSEKHLGKDFDLHAGGQDLIFPHHENEIAQSQAAFGPETFARHWMHNGILTVHGEKMSKSLGNFFTVQELLEKAPGEVLRFGILSTHYRQALDWTDLTISSSKAALDRLYTALKGLSGEREVEPDERVLKALEDDLNTPLAISHLHQLAQEIHKETDPNARLQKQHLLRSSGAFLGLLQEDPEVWFKKGSASSGISEEEIQTLIEDRQKARKNKDFARADQIRQHLLNQGIVLEDTARGTDWRRG